MAAPNYGFDLTTAQDQLSRRKLLLAALEKQSMAGFSPTVKGGPYEVANWGDAIGRVTNSYMAKREGDSLKADEDTLAGDVNKRTAEVLGNYFKTREGSTLPEMGPPTGEGEMSTGAYKPDPRKAAIDMVASGLPDMKAIGLNDLSSMNKNAMTMKDWAGLSRYNTPASIAKAQASGDLSQLEPLPHVVTAGEVAATISPTGQSPTITTPITRYDQGGLVAGVPAQTEQTTGKAHALLGGNSSPDNSVEKMTREEAIKQISKEKPNAQIAGQTAVNAQKALQVVQGIPDQAFGTFGNFALSVNKALEGLGLQPAFNTKDTERVDALNMTNLAEVVRAFAPVDDADIKLAMKQAGSITNTKQGLTSILGDIYQRKMTQLGQYQHMVQEFAKREPKSGPAFASTFSVELPDNGKEATDTQMASAEGFAPAGPSMPAPASKMTLQELEAEAKRRGWKKVQ